MKFVVIVLTLFLFQAALADVPAVDARLTPAVISVGETSELTISASGADAAGAAAARIAPPVVPGLRFTPVGQSRRVESINGVVTATASFTYQVTADEPGTYVIAGIAPGMKSLVLKVEAGAQAGAPAGAPPAAPGVPRNGSPTAAGDAAAFVRLTVPTHSLYVGQSVPVEIQVGTHDGLVASLNGLPTLNGDAFTLDKLAPEPEQRTQEMIDGKPFTIFTWHSVLAAIKPGKLSLRMETPLTVRIPIQRPSARLSGDSTLEDVFNDPAFQGFFGGATEKDITVSSPPADFTVLDLPVEGRPQDFSGAVGQFRISSDVSSHSVVAGDPVTLRMKVSGEGSFDRVASPMLGVAPPWKTYQPTSKFIPTGANGYLGEKIFEQPIVSTEPGRLVVPPLSFSYFDPVERRYATARSEPLTVDVSPAAGSAPVVAASGGRPAVPAPAATGPTDLLRPDHAPGPAAVNTLVPLYFQAPYAAAPATIMLALPAAWAWFRRREVRRRARQEPLPISPKDLVAHMDRAAEAGSVPEFFRAARSLMQNLLASRWQIAVEAVTLAEVDARLGGDSEVRRLFVLADEARYAGGHVDEFDLAAWRRFVMRQLGGETAS